MANIAERNQAGRYYVNTRLGVAKIQRAEDYPEYPPTSLVYTLLSDLIEVKAKGFRGIVVTALTGMYLDESYNPLSNFYGCKPRSIFEDGIWYALDENGIPCGKSDPLNVAKNVNQLNEDWAQGKKPQTAAEAVVKFLRLVIKSNKSGRARLIDYFFYRLWSYSQSVSNFPIAEVEVTKTSRQTLGYKLVDFSLAYPESGKTPQFLVAEILSALFCSSEIKVVGGGESVFATNTTSKKPADIWLENGGVPTNLYEVTLKSISKKRLDDSIDALQSTGHINHSVTFICRMDLDLEGLDVKNGSLQYKSKRFDFVDYRAFCLSLFALLSDKNSSNVLQNIAAFVRDKNISIETKRGWNNFFEREIDPV